MARRPPLLLVSFGFLVAVGVNVIGVNVIVTEPHGQGELEPEPPHDGRDQEQVGVPQVPLLGHWKAPEGWNWACK